MVIKVAGRDEDGDFCPPLYDTVDDFLQNNKNKNAEFVFCVINRETGKEPDNMAEAYENINDAYSAFVRHKYAEKARQEAIETLASNIRNKGVQLSYYMHKDEWSVSLTYTQSGTLKYWQSHGPDLKALLEDATTYINEN